MSERTVSILLRRLGLLARKDVTLDQYGNRVSGAIDPEVELLYTQVGWIHDKILDGRAIAPAELKFLIYCQERIDAFRQLVLQIEREYA